MNLVRILLLVFLIYAAMKQKSEESRNVVLIVTGLLAVCMMNKEGYLVKCNEADSEGHFTTSSAPGSCTGELLAPCSDGQVRHAETGVCQEATPPAPPAPPAPPTPKCESGKACGTDCVTGDGKTDTCGSWDNWEYIRKSNNPNENKLCLENKFFPSVYCKSPPPSPS
tara:strand:- start:13 stop:516 length:504 start_codon:yes stop_codon:yes gene_type:complete